MYAIIRTGGKQYKVQPGDVVRVEKCDGELGAELELTDVLMVGGEKTYIGEPNVKNAKVTVVVTNQARAPKVIIFKKKRRQGYRRLGGHRQWYTEFFVKSITTPEGAVAKADSSAVVFSPEKKTEKMAKLEDMRQKWKEQKHAAQSEEDPTPTAKKAAGKSGAKAKKPMKKKAKGASKSTKQKKTATKKAATTKKTAAKKKSE